MAECQNFLRLAPNKGVSVYFLYSIKGIALVVLVFHAPTPYFCQRILHHHPQRNMKATKKQQKDIQELLATITNSLRAFSLKLTGNMNDAEDLYQDTALRIMTNAEKYNPGTNFKAWAVTIMRNIFINNYRKKVRRNLIIDQTPNNYYINSGNKTVLNDGESEVTFNELQELVDRLPDDFRVPFLMAYQGYKYDEIAEQLGSPLGTIKSRIFFARKKLQKMYEEVMRERSVA